MRLFTSILAILLFFSIAQDAAAQRKVVKTRSTEPKVISCGVCNQDAIALPKPIYPSAAAAVNVSGSVSVEILIDIKGNVIDAKVSSGHPLLRSSSVKAALRAKFNPRFLSGNPVMVRGSIVYRFLSGKFEDPKKEDQATNIGIVNGRAITLPKPEHSQELKNLCADGRVEIEVLIGEDGSVLKATALTGDDLLFESALEAARRAKFQTYEGPPIKTRGILVYNFFLENKCVDVGIVNKKAVSLPLPVINAHAVIEKEIEVAVRVVINESGNVSAARALSRHPLIRHELERAALQAKFPPTLINPGPLRAKAIIVYKIKPDRTVDF